MTPLDFVLVLAMISVAAGVLGSLVGLGGGVVIVPVLTLGFHVDIRLAIGASIISVIATSSGAAAAYVKERMTNLRAGMFLEVATTIGAVTGALVTGFLPARALFILFAAVLGYSAVTMYRKHRESVLVTPDGGEVAREGSPVPADRVHGDRIADYFDLHGSYYDEAEGKEIPYMVSHTGTGLSMMYVAGMVSALLGIGSGALKVPAMDVAMHMPMKVSTATSNFMIGVTAAASAGVYFARGQIDPMVAAPVAVGVVLGALIGSRLLGRIGGNAIRSLFVIALVGIAVEMLQRGIA